jgi:hypothetical protein
MRHPDSNKTVDRDLHQEKQKSPTSSTVEGKKMDSMPVPENAEVSIRLRTEPEGISHRVRLQQSQKHSQARTWTDAGMQIDFREW